MSNSPPRLKVTLGPSDVSLSRSSVLSQEGLPYNVQLVPVEARLGALVLGRALDASIRNDSDYFIEEYAAHANPVVHVGEALKRVLTPLSDEVPLLVQRFSSMDAVEISVGLELLRETVVGKEGSRPEDDVLAAKVSGQILWHLTEDAGLTRDACARILTYASLDLYYYRRATPLAKQEFDALRDLIQLATGRRVDAVNQDERLSLGLSVWEGWQAVRGLDFLFGVGPLASQFALGRSRIMSGLFELARAVLVSASEALTFDEVREVIARLKDIADADSRPDDLRYAERAWHGFSEILDDANKTPVAKINLEPRSALESHEDVQRDAELDRMRTTLRSLAIMPAPKRLRTPDALVEDLSSVVERYEILMRGENIEMIFEAAPVLELQIRALYQELAEHHAPLEDAIYVDSDLEPQDKRWARALRSLVHRFGSFHTKYQKMRDSLASGEIPGTYLTDDVPPPEVPTPPPTPSPESGLVRRVGHALNEACKGRAHVLKTEQTALRTVWRISWSNQGTFTVQLTEPLDPESPPRIFVSHGNPTGPRVVLGRKGTLVEGGPLFESEVADRFVMFFAVLFSKEQPDRE